MVSKVRGPRVASVELKAERRREESWLGLATLAGLGVLVLVPCMVLFAAALGPFGLGFLALLALACMGMVGIGLKRHQQSKDQPRPVLTLGAERIVPGLPVSVDWRFDKGADTVRSVKLEAVAREWISHNMPNEGTVERRDVLRVQVGFGAGPTGGGELLLPDRAMPSFTAGSTRLEWRLELTGTSTIGPIDQRFEIQVLSC